MRFPLGLACRAVLLHSTKCSSTSSRPWTCLASAPPTLASPFSVPSPYWGSRPRGSERASLHHSCIEILQLAVGDGSSECLRTCRRHELLCPQESAPRMPCFYRLLIMLYLPAIFFESLPSLLPLPPSCLSHCRPPSSLPFLMTHICLVDYQTVLARFALALLRALWLQPGSPVEPSAPIVVPSPAVSVAASPPPPPGPAAASAASPPDVQSGAITSAPADDKASAVVAAPESNILSVTASANTAPKVGFVSLRTHRLWVKRACRDSQCEASV